ncbi:MAG: PDZ domain-containing protein, partial [Bacteriovoracaceae bacterium]|nr:PDZ domain-containing protein [Bacteriovoracaceae bacterium]
MEKMCWGIILACWLWGAARAVDNPAPKITATVEETAAPRATDAQVAQAQIRKNQLIGTILKTYLENYHFREMEINDQVSKKAFEQFIKKVDPGKQFLLESEYQRFAQKYRLAMDDLLLSGKGTIINEMLDLMHQRYQQLETFRAAAFKKPFDFKQQQFLELNPDKRKFATDMNQLKDYWFRMFKHSTLVRYFALVDEQQGQKENKNKNKNDKDKKDAEKVSSRLDEKANTSVEELLGEEMEASAAKKVENIANLSDRQLWAKAQEAIGKKYQRLYARLLKEDYEDYLEYFYNSITAIYDPHTVYMPPKRKEDFNIDISGSLEGIGAVLQEDESYIKVVKIIPGGAAWRQKELEVGDLIMAAQEADGELVDLVDMRVDDAVRYIRGKKGTQVRLTVKKVDGQVKVIPITRDVVEVGESYAKSSVINHKDSPYRIGYIYLPKFYRDFDEGTQRNCTDDILQKLKQFKEKDLDGVILDLRNNGGGSLKDAEQMTGLFIKEGPVVQVKERSGKAEVLADVDKNIAYEGPLIVLVNRFSASASEIVAGALQDYHRAVIVGGEFTHGKGTVQAVVGLNQGPILSLLGPVVGALKVTIQKFYR